MDAKKNQIPYKMCKCRHFFLNYLESMKDWICQENPIFLSSSVSRNIDTEKFQPNI